MWLLFSFAPVHSSVIIKSATILDKQKGTINYTPRRLLNLLTCAVWSVFAVYYTEPTKPKLCVCKMYWLNRWINLLALPNLDLCISLIQGGYLFDWGSPNSNSYFTVEWLWQQIFLICCGTPLEWPYSKMIPMRSQNMVRNLSTEPHLKGNSTLSGENYVKTVLSPIWKGSTLKGKNLLLKGANSFLLK